MEKPSSTGGQSRILFWEMLLLVAVVLFAYSPSFWNGFVYDDETYVLSNPLVRGKLDLHRIFTEPYPPGRADQGLYRPLVSLSYFLDHKLWGFAPRDEWNGFHLTNALLHALNGCLLLLLLSRLQLGRWMRLFACLVFVLHPALSEAVAWVVGRAELLGASFGLLAVLSFLRRPRGFHLVAALVFWTLAMLCKENWIVLPALIALLGWCVPGPLKLDRSAAIKTLCLAVLVGLVFWTARSNVFGNWGPEPALVAYRGVVSSFTRVVTALVALWKYVGLWLWPVPLSAQHDLQPVSNWGAAFFVAASWMFVFWLAWRARPIFPWFMLAVGWFWIAILPVSNLLIPIGAVFGERFLYLPSLFFGPALVLGTHNAMTIAFPDKSMRKAIGLGMGLACCLLLFAGLWLRLGDWRSNLALWESAARRYPRSLTVKALLSDALLREGRFAEAHVLAAEAEEQLDHQPLAYQKLLKPGLVRVNTTAQLYMGHLAWFRRFTVANDAARNGRNQEALAAYRALILDFPEESPTYEAIGDLYLRLNNPVAAWREFANALRFSPNPSPRLWAKYGQVLSGLGRKAEALMAYDRSLELGRRDPLTFVTHYHRGLVLTDVGDYDGALAAFAEASRLAPKFVESHLNRAAVFIHLKRFEEAQAELSEVIKLDPKRKEAFELQGKIPNSKIINPAKKSALKPSDRETHP